MDWHAYWTAFPKRHGAQDFCEQVGRFSRGVPTSPEELAVAVAQVHEGLALTPEDRVLDLCCGNGLLTMRYAGRSRCAVGLDFSEDLIQIARTYHQPPGVGYVCAAVEDLSPVLFEPGLSFDKISVFESIQYFPPEALGAILDRIGAVAAPVHRVYLSGILDHDRLDLFLDTPERRRRYEEQCARGQHEMGHWWQRAHLQQTAGSRRYCVTLRDQDPRLNTARYRFDAILVQGPAQGA